MRVHKKAGITGGKHTDHGWAETVLVPDNGKKRWKKNDSVQYRIHDVLRNEGIVHVQKQSEKKNQFLYKLKQNLGC